MPTTPSAPAPSAPAPKKLVPSATVAGAKSSKPAASAPTATDTFKYKYTPEDAEGLIAELIPDNFKTDLGDGNWKVRLAALDEMVTWLEGVIESAECELIFRFLGKKPGWNEKNFQVRLFNWPICIFAPN